MTADVTARLADGASAVANTATYVAARRAGVSPQTVRDSYSAEDGMRLADLDADGAALTGAAVAGDEAIRAARDALTTLREAWQGPAAAAAVGAVEAQCQAAADLVVGLRDAAAALQSLREHLAQVVDAKVEAALRMDPEREPHADSDVGTEWVNAMRSASDEVAAAYDEAIGRLSRRPGEEFTGSAPQVGPPVASPSLPSLGLPAGFGAGLPAVLPALLAGVAEIADAVSDRAGALEPEVVGSAIEPAEPEPAAPTDRPEPEPEPEPEPVDEPSLPPEPKAVAGPAPVAEPTPEPAPVAEPEPDPEPEPMAVAETPPAAGERTPCEIAADELPQVGD